MNAMPELADVRMGCRASSGSNIYGSLTGHLIKGPGSWHFYFLIDDATKIPELGDLLVKRLWLTGQGHILITANGNQLVRSLADPCVWQANRPDFVADAVCSDMLEKKSVALKEAIDTLTGLALMKGATHPVYRRVAKYDGKYYIDIGDPEWHVIELDESGWSVIQDPPVRFQRSGSSQALPMPVPGTGDIDLLWDVVNVEERQKKFILAWMIDALRPDTPYPVCELSGQQGTAKSGSHRAIRAVIDPNKVPLRSEPKGREAVQVQAGISHMVSYENLSRLAKPVQDLLSVIATGGGTGQRTLYTTNDETVIKLKNPIFLNGIHPVITMADLADRAINLTLPPIPKSARLLEADVHAQFEASKSAIFTGLLDAYTGALSELPNIVIKDPPRMIEFSYLGEALCRYFGWKQTFDTEYQQMRARLLLESAQGSPVIVAISEMTTTAKQPNVFKGTFKQLLERLDDFKPESYEGWPKFPKRLSEQIARHTPGLAEMGVKIDHLGHSRDGNRIRISKM
jgi:hypothetical protein